MKHMLTLLFKLLLLLVLLGAVGIAFYAGYVWTGWPLWLMIFIFLGGLGFFLGLLFIRKLWLKKREQKFVSQIIEQDNRQLKLMNEKEQQVSRQMQDKWKQAVDSLKKSHLKRKGNPLYVLPWYMIIGKSGSGKTTAIKSAGLSSSFSEVTSVTGISGTRNCDWWFLEQAVLIDTAGRYAVPVDQDRDKNEWQKFLTLLAKYRKKEPLNGLVVTVGAEDLNALSTEELERYGKEIRTRLDELMLVLNAKFPVYVLVTKCDLIQGMNQFCDFLGETNLNQAMGIVNDRLEHDALGLVSDGFRTIGEKIRDLRLLMMQNPQGRQVPPELILFPTEFEKIKQGVESFIKGVFQETPYQETPIFRGLYFSSGMQEGTPFSHFLKDLGLMGNQSVQPGTSRGLFLHDFFSKLLPLDRRLFQVTQRSAAWNRLTRNIGFAAWTTLIIAFCGVLSFSFVKNLQTMKSISGRLGDNQILSGELTSDIYALDRFKDAVKEIEAHNSHWMIPKLGLRESERLESELKNKYCSLVEKRFIDPFNKELGEYLADFNASTPSAHYITVIEHLVKRILILKARLPDSQPDIYENMALPVFSLDAPMAEQETGDIRLGISPLYLHYLYWQKDAQSLNLRMNRLQQLLARTLSIKGADLNWLVLWANADPQLSPVTLTEFWGRGTIDSENIFVPAGLTRAGKDKIDKFIADIEEALIEPLILSGKKRNFHQWYQTTCLDTWLHFVSNFDAGFNSLQTREGFEMLAGMVPTPRGPYLSLLTTLYNELGPFSKAENLPEWAGLVMELDHLEKQAKMLRVQRDQSSGVLKKTVSKVKSQIKGISKAEKIKKAMDSDTMIEAAKTFNSYQDAIVALPPMVSSRRASAKLASAIYSEDPANSDHVFFKAGQAVKKLKRMMGYPGKEPGQIWHLLEGPMNFYHEFSNKETACYLQKRWEQDVLVQFRDVSDDKNRNQVLLGPEGFVTTFVKGPGKPFIKRGLKKGFYSAKVMGRQIPFYKSFFQFLSRGRASAARTVKDSYGVKIKADPTDTNEDAAVKPEATRLELVCADQTILLENYNYPKEKVFTWAPESECEVIFSIKFRNLVLTRRYTGKNAFPRFLKSFSRGRVKFLPSDFPEHQDDLNRMGVKFIRVRYQFKGHQSVIGLLHAGPGRVPTEIVQCWD